jgi:hypothetical protein
MLVFKKKVLLLSLLGLPLIVQGSELPKPKSSTPVPVDGDAPKSVDEITSHVGGRVIFDRGHAVLCEPIDSDSDEKARVVHADSWDDEEIGLDLDSMKEALNSDQFKALKRVAETMNLRKDIADDLVEYAKAPGSPDHSVSPKAVALTVITTVPAIKVAAFALDAASARSGQSGTTYSSVKSAESRDLNGLFSPDGKMPSSK